ncbi:MAG: hypothetical protein H7Z41_07840 [Cytophagales bacterium]|nr:hypothetical protein [Armatimonadota bacterium]
MYIVGITGGSASGKSAFAGALEKVLAARDPALRVRTIPTDQHWKDRSGSPRFVSPSSGEAHFNFNHPDALNEDSVLAALKAAPADIVLLEGLMVLHLPALRNRLDLRLFIELDADERALRRLLRDMQGGRDMTDPQKIAAYYRESARVGHALYIEPSRVHADLILRGDSNFARTADLVSTVILDRYRAPKSG